MVNRRTGLVCNFYTDTENGIENVVESRIREGFTRITEKEGRVKSWDPYGNGKGMFVYTEMEGARLFRKKFGRSRTYEDAIKFIVDMGLAEDRSQAQDVLQYMVDNDIPYRKRFLLEFNDWHYFTLIPDKNNKVYRINDYGLTLGEFFLAWKAATIE